MNTPRISIIAGIGQNRELGQNNDLIWHVSPDLKRFKELTTGHPVIMGRKTFESIGKPLPGRTNIVITRNTNWKHDGVIVVHTLHEALDKAKESESDEIFIIGGAQIYTDSLPYTDRLYLTIFQDEAPGADTFFPEYEHLFTTEIHKESTETEDGLQLDWIMLEK